MSAIIIGYMRVSTKMQGECGLDVESQRATLEAHAQQTGGPLAMVYVEIESGKRTDRPELAKAIAHAKRSKGTLAVAKLDHLARNVSFLSALMDSKVAFVAIGIPYANPLTLHILVAVAEAEALAISQRTKAALTAYKTRGGKLGAQLPQCRNLTLETRQKGAKRAAEARGKAADAAYADLWPMMIELRKKGMTLQAIADDLNTQGHTTRRGKPWNIVQVSRVLERAAQKLP